MKTTTTKVAAIFSLMLVGVYCMGVPYHTCLNWGIHFLGFLPLWFTFLYLALAIILFFSTWKGYSDRFLSFLSDVDSVKPIMLPAFTIALFVISAVILRVKTPLLGDSFILLNNYEGALSGEHPLYLHRAPLSFSYFYLAASLLKVTQYPDLLDAFLAGEILLGVGFIISIYFIVRLLFTDAKTRIISFVLLVTLPSMEVLFGYVELYSMVSFTLSLFVLASLLVLKQKAPFWIVPLAFLLLLSANYLMFILFPALLFLTVQEWQKGKRWTIIAGYGLAIVIVVSILAATGFDIQKFIPPSKQSHALSLTGKGDQYEAYSLFSIFHIIDLGNLILLLGMPALFFLVVSLVNDIRAFFRDYISIFFLCAIILVVGFLSVAKFDLGIAKDWDVNAGFFFLFTVAGLYLFLRESNQDRLTALTILACIAGLNSFVWISLNSTTAPMLNRVHSLLDTRMTSKDGYYQSLYHLSSYYQHTNEVNTQIEIWNRYVGMYPDDWRGYRNLTQSLNQDVVQHDSLTLTLYEHWHSFDSENAKGEYSDFLTRRGIKFYRLGYHIEAESEFTKAISVNSECFTAYNNLASLYIDSSQYDKAMTFCKKAIELNPRYALAYLNLGNTYLQTSLPDSAIQSYQTAIGIEPNNFQAYENMSRAYYQKGDVEKALEVLQQAARLGSKTAQYLLSQSGKSW